MIKIGTKVLIKSATACDCSICKGLIRKVCTIARIVPGFGYVWYEVKEGGRYYENDTQIYIDIIEND